MDFLRCFCSLFFFSGRAMKQQIWERSSSKLEESSWNLIGVLSKTVKVI